MSFFTAKTFQAENFHSNIDLNVLFIRNEDFKNKKEEKQRALYGIVKKIVVLSPQISCYDIHAN